MAAKTGVEKTLSQTLLSLLASSRPIQSTLSVSQPLFGALVALRGFPSVGTLLLLIIGGVSGLYAVFSLNDLLDYSLDVRAGRNAKKRGWDVDSVLGRHPLASGTVTMFQQAAWICAMAAISISCLYLLSPFALGLFFLAVLLEAAYCKLARITELKFIVAGAVVAVGVLIGWFAAGGTMQYGVLVPLCALFFAWEVGGRNIPNDFSDLKQDRILGIRTLPSVYGANFAASLVTLFGLAVIASNYALYSSASLGLLYLVATTLCATGLLLLPARGLFRAKSEGEALRYFNTASLFPVFALMALVLALLFKLP